MNIAQRALLRFVAVWPETHQTLALNFRLANRKEFLVLDVLQLRLQSHMSALVDLNLVNGALVGKSGGDCGRKCILSFFIAALREELHGVGSRLQNRDAVLSHPVEVQSLALQDGASVEVLVLGIAEFEVMVAELHEVRFL